MRLHVCCLALLLSACMDLGAPPEGAEDRPELDVTPAEEELLCDATPFAPLVLPESLLDLRGVDCDPEDEAYCFGLRPDLREVAAEADPLAALRASARAYDAFADDRDVATRQTADALADLAVSGARAYARFASAPPRLDDLGDASPAARRRALTRAYEVAWALRGPPSHRLSARDALGPVAVSAADDPPARPVNIPGGAFPQADLFVSVGGRDVRTRSLVMSTETGEPAAAPEDLVGALPEEPLAVPASGPIVLFVPGHSSLAEEGAPLGAALVARAAQRGDVLTVVSFDLPSNAYAERLDPADLVDAADGADDALLRFHDAFLDGVVAALDARQPGAADRIVAVIGGSLGGNLVLRLGERQAPYARRLVAWSPASVDFSWTRARWPLAAGEGEFVDIVKHEAVRLTRDASEEAEEDDSRRDYFVGGLSSVRKQAHYWYRDGWECKEAMIAEGLAQLGEIYDDRFRRWHYRVAYEQLVFSHVEPTSDDGARPYESIRAPLLLVAGEEDNGVPMQTRFFVERLSEQLVMPGETIFLQQTGHALHSERPALLAERIDGFLDL